MRDKDTYALREMFQYSSLAEKPLDQWEIATHWRAFQIQDKSRHCDPHLDHTKFNGLLPLTIDGVLVKTGYCLWRICHSYYADLPILLNVFLALCQTVKVWPRFLHHLSRTVMWGLVWNKLGIKIKIFLLFLLYRNSIISTYIKL